MVAFTDYLIDTRVRREAEALVERGDGVEVICLAQKEKIKLRTLKGVKLSQLPIQRYRGSNTMIYLIKYAIFFVAAFFVLSFKHLKNKYQIIQVHSMPEFMVFVAFIPKLFGAKVVLDVHDLMPELFQSKFGIAKSHWFIRFLTWMERLSVSFAHRAIAVHKPHLDVLVRHGNPADKFIVLLNLPDPRFFPRQVPAHVLNKNSLRFIYHGTISRRHGLDVALNAIAQVRQEIKELDFKIIGEGDAVPHLVDLTKELKLTDCVSFIRFVMPEELSGIILKADIGIIPILYDNFTKYMLPVKLLEYVALRIPVICSRTETMQAYFDDTMVEYFEPGDIAELADHIRILYRNPQRRESLHTNADRFNRMYNWDQQKHIYYEFIDNLISRRY